MEINFLPCQIDAARFLIDFQDFYFNLETGLTRFETTSDDDALVVIALNKSEIGAS